MNCCFRPIAPDKGANKKCKKICIYQAQSPSLHCWPSHSRPAPSAHWYKLGSEPPDVEQSELRTSPVPHNGVKEPKQSSDAEQPDLSSETPRDYEDFMTLGCHQIWETYHHTARTSKKNLDEKQGYRPVQWRRTCGTFFGSSKVQVWSPDHWNAWKHVFFLQNPPKLMSLDSQTKNLLKSSMSVSFK